MIIINEEQKEFLRKYIPDIDFFVNDEDFGDLLIEIDDAIIDYGMDKQQEITNEGLKIEKIYDEIYQQNVESSLYDNGEV